MKQTEQRAIGIIPARYASTRLNAKPLIEICGKPMIQWVYEQASGSKSLSEVLVATDDDRIRDAVLAFGGKAVMTSPEHRCGTERIAEAAEKLSAEVVVNIQGDEPLLPPQVIDVLVETIRADDKLNMATAACPLGEQDEMHDPNVVKVARDLEGRALYFSRAGIPYWQQKEEGKHASRYAPTLKHIGIYAYRKEFLLRFVSWEPTPLEITESLEQLRALEHGEEIQVIEVNYSPVGVDTQADLDRVRALMEAKLRSVSASR